MAKITLRYNGVDYELATAVRDISHRPGKPDSLVIVFSELNWWVDRIPQAHDIHYTYPQDGSLHLTLDFSDDTKIHFYKDRVAAFASRTAKDPVSTLRDIIGIKWLDSLDWILPKKPHPKFEDITDFIGLPARGVLCDDSFPQFYKAILSKRRSNQATSDYMIEFDQCIGFEVKPFVSKDRNVQYNPENPNVHIIFDNSSPDPRYPAFGYIVTTQPLQ